MFRAIKYATLALAAEAITIDKGEEKAVIEAVHSDYAVTVPHTIEPW